MQMEALYVRIKTLTPIWTGGIDGKCDRLHETGIIGSLRWWYEALIRGLGGYACDPTDGGCRLDGIEKTDEDPKQKICPVCYLFGCTGWQRKFRFEIRKDEKGRPGSRKLGKIIDDEKLWLCFIQLKPMDFVEKSLLTATLRICSHYGAIGGKTIYKPSENPDDNGRIPHKDYGLFQIEPEMTNEEYSKKVINNYLKTFSQKMDNHPFWPDLRYFWFASTPTTLNRVEINNIVGRNNNGEYLPNIAKWQKWLGGDKGDSKKIFSFYTRGGERTWGYFNKENYEKAKQELKNSNITWGEGVLNEFFN